MKNRKTGSMEFLRNEKNRITDLVLLALIAVFGFYVNREIVIKGLYMDDLYMWSCYGEQNLIEFAFPIGTSTRFRPVYWLATYLQMMIVGTQMTRFVTFNIVINIAAAFLLYLISGKLSRSRTAAFVTAVCYLASRFAYYQIGQALGLMETMALCLAIGILYLLYRFMMSGFGREEPGQPAGKSSDGFYYTALLLYFLLAFTHERYIALIPLFYLVLLVRLADSGKDRRPEMLRSDAFKWIAPAAVLLVIVAIRTFAIGKAIPAGTGGTQVTETFRIGECLSYALSQVWYLFGINAGPEHLNGLPWDQTPLLIKRLVKLGVLMIGVTVLLYLVSWITAGLKEMKNGRGSRTFLENLAVCLLFGGFIALCIACSSVTIRVEMRWIYVSYAAALLFASYMLGFLKQCGRREIFGTALLCFLLYGIISTGTNIYYRGYFGRLYFWPNQLRMNSLAEQTVEKYGTGGVFGKNIYILENTYEMSDFYGRTFFKTFDPEKKAEGTQVIFAGSLDDVPKDEVRNGQALVLKEVPEENAYLDITGEVAGES